MGEILLIAVVALLVVGPDRLPGAAKAIGKGIRDLRASTKDLQATIEQDTQIGDAVRELKGALRGDPETLYKRATGEDFHASPTEEGESEFPDDPEKLVDARDSEKLAAETEKVDAASSDDASSDDASSDEPEADGELDDLLDKAYANSNDPWGTEAVNPHEAEATAPDPDLPLIKQPAGAVARASIFDEAGEDEDDASNDDSSHG